MSNTLFKTSFMDAVFERKNKSFGAYNLRQKYVKSILLSLLISGTALAASVGVPFAIHKFSAGDDKKIKKKDVDVVVKTVKIEPPAPTPPPPPPPQKIKVPEPLATVDFRDMKVVKDDSVNVDERLTKVKETKTAVISNTNTEGTEQSKNLPDEFEVDTTSKKEPAAPKIYQGFVAEKAVFEGGDNAFSDFFAEHFEYPEAAKIANIKGTVFAEILINEVGAIEEVKIVKGLGYGIDEEVTRILLISPPWTPGKADGISVRYWMRKPIKLR